MAAALSSGLPKPFAYFRVQIEPIAQVVPVERAEHCQLAACSNPPAPLADHFTGLPVRRRQHWSLPRPMLATITAAAELLCDRRHKLSF